IEAPLHFCRNVRNHLDEVILAHVIHRCLHSFVTRVLRRHSNTVFSHLFD
ncbi:hypothetical protein L9F63_012209, partial [Diploptera punctata]